MSRQTLREAALIIIAGFLLGVMYTGVTGKGLFAPPPPPEETTNDNAPAYIDYADVLSLHESHGAIIVDARHEYDYNLGHITGAVNLPLKEFDERKGMTLSWPKDTTIVTYCDGQECNSSIDLADKLAAQGFRNVHFFFGGWSEWEANGGPTEHPGE